MLEQVLASWEESAEEKQGGCKTCRVKDFLHLVHDSTRGGVVALVLAVCATRGIRENKLRFGCPQKERKIDLVSKTQNTRGAHRITMFLI